MSLKKEKKTQNSNTFHKMIDWIDDRFPLTEIIENHFTKYYAPKNFNFWYFFGSLACFVLAIQIITGICLVMHYKPDAEKAFESIEYIMREVPWGWLIRYMHSTGASMFFVVIYLHIFRGLLYGSYRKPRELVWILGCIIFLCLMAEAFMGYLLPWGQMSYWGAQVIINLFSSIPIIGSDLSLWIRGDYVIGDATLNRFFSFHIILVPIILITLAIFHIVALHKVGSNNPDGIEIKENVNKENDIPIDGIPLHPYYSIHDLFGISIFLIIFFFIIFFSPEVGGYFLEYNNFIPADPLKTPSHIAPVWYFTPFYSMLRATTSEFLLLLWIFFGILLSKVIRETSCKKVKYFCFAILIVLAIGFSLLDAKFWGFLIMFSAVLILFFLPWLDRSPVKSIRYKPCSHKLIYSMFVITFVAILGYLGSQPPSLIGERLSQVGTLIYFAFFLMMPWWSRMGTFKKVPNRVNL